jgi:hypothetical protein
MTIDSPDTGMASKLRSSLLGTIRQAGGVITRSCPRPGGFLVTYLTRGG